MAIMLLYVSELIVYYGYFYIHRTTTVLSLSSRIVFLYQTNMYPDTGHIDWCLLCWNVSFEGQTRSFEQVLGWLLCNIDLNIFTHTYITTLKPQTTNFALSSLYYSTKQCALFDEFNKQCNLTTEPVHKTGDHCFWVLQCQGWFGRVRDGAILEMNNPDRDPNISNFAMVQKKVWLA